SASLAPARMKTAGTAVAGVGIYLPPAGTSSAPHFSGADCHGVSNRVEAGQGLSTPSLAAGAARAALRAATVPVEAIQLIVVGTAATARTSSLCRCAAQGGGGRRHSRLGHGRGGRRRFERGP